MASSFFVSANCLEISSITSIALMCIYFITVQVSAYIYGRHRGEYCQETKKRHKLWSFCLSYLLPYILIIAWIFYTFFHSKNDINFISTSLPWLTLYGVSYIVYSIIFTLSFIHYSQYDKSA